MRSLLILIVVLAGVWFVRRALRARRERSPAAENRRQEAVAEPILPCRQCGVHVPRSEAVAGTSGWYCSEAHRRAAGD